MKTVYILLLTCLICFTSCETKKPAIEGLWEVTSVTMGRDEVTPNARWMRFHADFSQESGNGWYQHSVGTWKLDSETNELVMVNSNGLADTNDPFKITISQNTMVWNRTEEGHPIQVKLKKINQLPETHGDQLLGLWKLEKSEGSGNYFSASEASNEYLYLGWDRRFLIGTKNRKIRGIYNVHGHKKELQLIPYDEKLKRNFWKFTYENQQIILKLLNSDSLVTRTFTRIHEFPQ